MSDDLATAEELERLRQKADAQMARHLTPAFDVRAMIEAEGAYVGLLKASHRAGRLVHTDSPEWRGMKKLALVGWDYAGERLLSDADVAAALAALDDEAAR